MQVPTLLTQDWLARCDKVEIAQYVSTYRRFSAANARHLRNRILRWY
jgi:hypothetical protein